MLAFAQARFAFRVEGAWDSTVARLLPEVTKEPLGPYLPETCPSTNSIGPRARFEDFPLANACMWKALDPWLPFRARVDMQQSEPGLHISARLYSREMKQMDVVPETGLK